MNDVEFKELQEPKRTPWGWYVPTPLASSNADFYLHSDLELHRHTGNPDKDVWPGYFPTEEDANKYRDLYYAKYATPVIKRHNEDAWERAMNGI